MKKIIWVIVLALILLGAYALFNKTSQKGVSNEMPVPGINTPEMVVDDTSGTAGG